MGVSVVVPAHDPRRWESLQATLASVANQTITPDAIVVAVDHSPELEALLATERPDILVAPNTSPERGASATRNIGAAAVSSEFIAFIDDDEVAEPDWLAQLLTPFSDPAVVGTGGRYVPAWEHHQPRWFPEELAWVVGAHHTGMPHTMAPVRNVWSGNMAVRATAFHAVGGFRIGFGKVGNRSRPEDTELCIRMAAAVPGGLWMYLPEARIHHTVPGDRSTFGFFVRRCYAEGRGKIDLAEHHPDTDALSTERQYLRETIPRGVGLHAVDAAAAIGRIGAIGVGIGAAGVGAVVSRAAQARAARAAK